MSNDKIFDLAAQMVDRRKFLAKLGAGALGSIGIMLGLSTKALALYSYECCNLCNPANSPNCCGGQCAWCWTCYSGVWWQCCECYQPGYPCNGTCGHTICSWYRFYSYRPAPTTAGSPRGM